MKDKEIRTTYRNPVNEKETDLFFSVKFLSQTGTLTETLTDKLLSLTCKPVSMSGMFLLLSGKFLILFDILCNLFNQQVWDKFNQITRPCHSFRQAKENQGYAFGIF